MSYILTPHWATASGFVVTLTTPRTVTHTTVSPANAVAALQLKSDGKILIANTDAGLIEEVGVEWLDPEDATEASNYEAMAEMTAGTLSSGTENAYEVLSTSRTYQKIRTSNTPGTDTCSFNLKIRHKTTLAVHATAAVTLNAVVT